MTSTPAQREHTSQKDLGLFLRSFLSNPTCNAPGHRCRHHKHSELIMFHYLVSELFEQFMGLHKSHGEG